MHALVAVGAVSASLVVIGQASAAVPALGTRCAALADPSAATTAMFALVEQDPSLPGEVEVGFCVRGGTFGTVASATGTLTVSSRFPAGPLPSLQIVSSDPGVNLVAQNAQTIRATSSAIPASPGGTALRIGRVRIVPQDGQPLTGTVLLDWPFQYVNTPGGGGGGTTRAAIGFAAPPTQPTTPVRTPCGLTSRSLDVSRRALTFRQLTTTGLVAGTQLCADEVLSGSLHTADTSFDVRGEVVGRSGQHLGANSLFTAATQQGPQSLPLKASGRGLLYQLAGVTRIKVNLVAWRSYPEDPEPSTVTYAGQALIRLVGPPPPMGKPPFVIRKTAAGLRLVLGYPFMPALAGRTAVIERRVGTRWVTMASVRIGARGALAYRTLLDPARAGSATGVAGVRIIRLRVRVLAKGGRPALAGVPNTARLP